MINKSIKYYAHIYIPDLIGGCVPGQLVPCAS